MSIRRSFSLCVMTLVLATSLFAAAPDRGDASVPQFTARVLYPIDAAIADGNRHHLTLRVVAGGRVLHQEDYVFTAEGNRRVLPLLLAGATREVLDAVERDHAGTTRVGLKLDDRAEVEMALPELLALDRTARSRSLAPVLEMTLIPQQSQREAKAQTVTRTPKHKVRVLTEQMCPNSGYCMDDYRECKGGGDNEGNEWCDFELQRCQFGEHYTREVRTNNQYSFAFAIELCAFDDWWEAFNPHIYLQGSHTYTDQVWDDWYCQYQLVSSTLISSTNGSETCYYQTSTECEFGHANNIGGECTYEP